MSTALHEFGLSSDANLRYHQHNHVGNGTHEFEVAKRASLVAEGETTYGTFKKWTERLAAGRILRIVIYFLLHNDCGLQSPTHANQFNLRETHYVLMSCA